PYLLKDDGSGQYRRALGDSLVGVKWRFISKGKIAAGRSLLTLKSKFSIPLKRKTGSESVSARDFYYRLRSRAKSVLWISILKLVTGLPSMIPTREFSALR